jgi:sugar transferase EpsL
VRRFERSIKRGFDICASTLGLVAASPLLMATSVAIRITMGRPILFRQVRPGLHGEPFEVIKFRTMRDSSDTDGKPLSDADRLTRLGQVLRATSVDELPQLVSVLRGDMSLVGPRPLLMQYLRRYSPGQARRHEMRPGVTGWAQVNGRNAISWEEKFALDVWYVDNWSLWLDAKILALTILSVIRRSGISQEGHSTMPEFMGSHEVAP